MVLPAPALIPDRVLASVMAAEKLGELHLALAPTATWRSPNLPDPLRREVAEYLTTLGWRGRDGTLEREVAASLTVLSQPTVAYYGAITSDDMTITVLAAAVGKEAVLAVRRPDSMIWLSSIGAGRLAEQLVAQTPDRQTGQGNPVTVSLAELHSVSRSGRQRAPGGIGTRLASPEIRRVQQILALPTTGAGELYVEISDPTSLRRSSQAPVSYVDTTLGRYVETTPRDGQLRIGPASREDLVTALHAVHRRLAGAGG